MVGNETLATILLSESTLNSISPLLGKLSVLLGGIFGLSAILIITRIYFERQRLKVLQDIRYNLEQLNSHFGVSSSQHRLGYFRRNWQRLRIWYYNFKHHDLKHQEPSVRHKK
ncbi:hypothetical protein HYV86_06850 [Candidatus Woesearchaeota archaeon]|nr:hypothetical protein [Candidatus Woesearchaeota archaeon]